jgi:aconitate hydratase
MTEPVGQGKGGATCTWATSGPAARKSMQLMKFAMNGKAFRENYAKVASEPGKLWKIGREREHLHLACQHLHCRAAVLCEFAIEDVAGAAGATGQKDQKPIGAGRAHHGAVWRLHHHRPHLARWLHQRDFPAGQWLLQHGVQKADFNSYGARRGNHDVMVRGTFANVRIKNLMIPPAADGSREEGGVTVFQSEGRWAKRCSSSTPPCTTWRRARPR